MKLGVEEEFQVEACLSFCVFNLKCLAWSYHVRVPSLADIVGSQTWTSLIHYRESENISGWLLDSGISSVQTWKGKRATRPD